MFKITILYIELTILLILALASDIKTYKIKNFIILPAIIAGLGTNLFLDGFEGLKSSFIAMLVPVFVLFILYILRMLGAGDIKLFGAIGSIMGLEFVLYTIAYSFISGGIIALFLILIRKNGKQRLQYLFKYLKSCFLTFSIQPYTEFEDKSDGAKFHFAYAIICGALIESIINLMY